jgi:hypothetical protein
MSDCDDGFGGSPNRIPQAALDAERRSWAEYDKKCVDDYMKKQDGEIATLRARVATQAEIITVWSPLIDALTARLSELDAAARVISVKWSEGRFPTREEWASLRAALSSGPDAPAPDDEVRGPPCECGSVRNIDEDGCCRTCGVDWNYELALWQDGYVLGLKECGVGPVTTDPAPEAHREASLWCPQGCKGIEIQPGEFSGCGCRGGNGCDCPNHPGTKSGDECPHCEKDEVEVTARFLTGAQMERCRACGKEWLHGKVSP